MEISDIEVKVIKTNTKHMRLSISLGKNVFVLAPLEASDDAISLFVNKKIEMIKKRIEKCKNQPGRSENKYISGETNYLWGQKYIMEVRYARPAYNKVEIEADKMILTVKTNSTLRDRKKVVNDWYRDEIRAKLPELIEKWQKIIGVKISSFGVRTMMRNWSSFIVKDKKLWINLLIARKSVNCLEYIIVREMVNLLKENQTNASEEYLDKLLPNWRLYEDELNQIITAS